MTSSPLHLLFSVKMSITPSQAGFDSPLGYNPSNEMFAQKRDGLACANYNNVYANCKAKHKVGIDDATVDGTAVDDGLFCLLLEG